MFDWEKKELDELKFLLSGLSSKENVHVQTIWTWETNKVFKIKSLVDIVVMDSQAYV